MERALKVFISSFSYDVWLPPPRLQPRMKPDDIKSAIAEIREIERFPG